MIIEIFDPPMCCPGGMCGPAIDPALLDVNEAILKVKKESDGQVQIERYLLTQQATKFMQNAEVLELLHTQGTAALPVTAVNGKVVKQKAYPTYTDLQSYIVQKGNARMSQTQYIFFAGKGGVGKTTMACATAYHYAQAGHRTLIITTDPASNLADVFEAEIGHKITPLKVPNLWAMEIDPDRATEEYRERILAPMRSVMPAEVLKVLEEQFRSPCTTEIASFDRFVDFIAGDGASRNGDHFEVIVFDTAPTGHTLRLLELPVDWSRHIEESAKGGGNTCIGPVASIQESKAKYDEAMRLLADRNRTRFFFVLQPEGTSLWETQTIRSGTRAPEHQRAGVDRQQHTPGGSMRGSFFPQALRNAAEIPSANRFAVRGAKADGFSPRLGDKRVRWRKKYCGRALFKGKGSRGSIFAKGREDRMGAMRTG